MRTLPNMTVVVPADERETEAVVEWMHPMRVLYTFVWAVLV